MTKITAMLYCLLLFGLTFTSYGIFFFVDYSADYFIIARALIMGVCFFYFYKLTKQLAYLKRAKEKLNTYPSAKQNGGTLIAFFLFIIHLILVNVGGKQLNEHLLKNNNKETIARIDDCYKSKGTEYCVYSYVVNNRHYEIKYCNEPENLKFKENDTTTVLYYPKFPAISKLKKELK